MSTFKDLEKIFPDGIPLEVFNINKGFLDKYLKNKEKEMKEEKEDNKEDQEIKLNFDVPVRNTNPERDTEPDTNIGNYEGPIQIVSGSSKLMKPKAFENLNSKEIQTFLEKFEFFELKN